MGKRGRPSTIIRDRLIASAAAAGRDFDVIALAFGIRSQTIPSIAKRVGVTLPRKKYTRTRPDKFDWASVDWTKNDVDIANRIGCTKERVRQRRNKLGMPKIERCKSRFFANKREEFAHAAASCTSAKDMAGKTGMGLSFIYFRSTQLGIKLPPAREPGKHLPTWAKTIDWSRSVVEIAKNAGVSKCRVEQVKIGLGLTKSNRSSVAWNLVDWSKPDSVIAKQLGMTRLSVWTHRPYELAG